MFAFEPVTCLWGKKLLMWVRCCETFCQTAEECKRDRRMNSIYTAEHTTFAVISA